MFPNICVIVNKVTKLPSVAYVDDIRNNPYIWHNMDVYDNVEIIHIDKPSVELEQYYSFEFGVPVNTVLNLWKVTVKYYLNEDKLNYEWEKIKAKRNKLLQESDWYLCSDIILDVFRERVEAYKQVLRDIPQVYKYPHEVVFPKFDIDYKIKFSHGQTLEDIEIEKIKDYIPSNGLSGWGKFLRAWNDSNFTANFRFVYNLMRMYGFYLDDVLNE